MQKDVPPMKRFIPLAALLACLPAVSAQADAWSDYNKVMSRYFQIDRQGTHSISCSISASPLDEAMGNMPSIAGNVSQQLSKFRVTVRSDGEVSFVMPEVRIDENPPEAGAEATKGMNLIVSGVRDMTSGILDSVVTQKQDKLKDLAVAIKGETSTVSFSQEQGGEMVKVEITYSGDTDTTKETSKDGVTNSTTKYIPLNGKLAPGASTAHRDGKEPLDASIDVKYQQVGKAWFPSRVVTDVKDKENPQGRHVVVDFRDCSGT